ncbi:MAG TPA: hypothetical protein DCY42_03220 [Chloroflexi bacterium]|nr:hypothetical protein [Chloroflexota bacterium]
MNWKSNLKNIYRWLLRGTAVLMIPSLFPSSVSMGDRVGWIGAVVLWFYMGRMIDRKKSEAEE